LIKFLAHIGSFGWGFFVDVILAAVVTAGAWAIVQRASVAGATQSDPRSTPLE
jgi:hypothetical protein